MLRQREGAGDGLKQNFRFAAVYLALASMQLSHAVNPLNLKRQRKYVMPSTADSMNSFA